MRKYCDDTMNTIITYSLIPDRSPHCEGIYTYGINAEMTENGKITCRSFVRDVFCFREEAENFIELLAKNGVEPCHLADIIYDQLSV